MRGQPGLCQRRGDQPERPDRPRGQPPAGLDQAGPEAVLVADADLTLRAPGQADDVDGLLDVGRKRLLDEHVAAGLKGVHRQAVMRQVRREDREGVGLSPARAIPDGRRTPARRPPGRPARSRPAPGPRPGRGRRSRPRSTPSGASRRSRWTRPTWPQPAIPIRSSSRSPCALPTPCGPDPAAPCRGTHPSNPPRPASRDYPDRSSPDSSPVRGTIPRDGVSADLSAPRRDGPGPPAPGQSRPSAPPARRPGGPPGPRKEPVDFAPDLDSSRPGVYRRIHVNDGGCGLAVKAPDCGSGYRGFESRHPP